MVIPLCDALTRDPPDAVAVERALSAGADPNVGCEVEHTRYAWGTPSLPEVLIGVLVPPIGLAMLLGAEQHEVKETRVLRPLGLAAAAGSLPILERLLGAGADPTRPDSEGHAALFYGAAEDMERSGTAFATRLAAAGGTLSGEKLERAWLDAAFDRPDLFRALQGAGLSIDTPDSQGDTLLARAVEADDLGRVERILVFRPDTNRIGHFRTAPLHEAVENRSVAMARLLLDHGASVDLPRDGDTPLVMAVDRGDVPMATLLLERGANPAVGDHWGNTLLHRAVEREWLVMVTFLLDRGLPVDATDRWGESALDLAIEERSWEIADALLARGARPDRAGSRGETALYRAVRDGDRELFDHLVPHTGREGLESAIQSALIHRRYDLAEAIVARGVAPRPQALLFHVRYGDADRIAWLLARGVTLPPEALHELVEDDDPEKLVFALAHGARLDAVDDEGRTPLARAVELGSVGHARVLLAHGADPEGLLAPVVEAGEVEMAGLLAAAGAHVGRAQLAAAIDADDVAMFEALAAHEHELPAGAYLFGLSLRAAVARTDSLAMIQAVRAAGRARR